MFGSVRNCGGSAAADAMVKEMLAEAVAADAAVRS
jgi:hypothetical protein